MNRVFRRVFLLALIFIAIGQSTNCLYAEKPGTAKSQNGHFYFIQITDTHFDDADHYQRTRQIVADINQLPMKIEFIVHTGDITMDLVDEEEVVVEGKAILNNLKAPLYYIPGNHDILALDIKNTRPAYNQQYGKLIQQVQIHGVTFVFMYTEPLAKSIVVPGYHPLEQLQALLQENKDNPVVICHHRPSVGSFHRNKMHSGWPETNRRKWTTILNNYNVKAVIAGHFHRDEHHWLGDVPLYLSASVAGYWGRQASYRIYEYNNGKIGYRTQYK